MEAALEVMNQEIVKEAKKFDSKAIEKAIEIALSMGGNMTGASKKIEKIAKGLSGEQKVKDALRLANESVEVVEDEAEVVTEAQSGGKEAYQKFFKGALKKFDVKSVAELDDKKKKEFFNYVDKNWEGDNEED